MRPDWPKISLIRRLFEALGDLSGKYIHGFDIFLGGVCRKFKTWCPNFNSHLVYFLSATFFFCPTIWSHWRRQTARPWFDLTLPLTDTWSHLNGDAATTELQGVKGSSYKQNLTFTHFGQARIVDLLRIRLDNPSVGFCNAGYI